MPCSAPRAHFLIAFSECMREIMCCLLFAVLRGTY